MKKLNFLILVAALVLVGAGCSGSNQAEEDLTFNFNDTVNETKTWEFPGKLEDQEIQNKQIHMKTEKGDIVFELFADTAPLTVSNFVYLTSGGYYNDLTFHRREERFVIQGGDPSGNGTGGPGYKFEDELTDTHQYDKGIVAMANSGPNTNGSQFFIMLGDTPLPKAYSIFGRVTEGIDVVDQIQIGDKMTEVLVEDKK
jgi:peptidyl-prolyl cis-trans isomerase B (cyclophilin B)